MPSRPPRICAACGLKVAAGSACPCQTARKAAADRARPGPRQRGYDSRWDRETREFLGRPENRLCGCGCGRPADTVDHVVAHKGDMRLFWDKANWRAVAGRCNSRKAAASEGGFGNPIRAGAR